MKHELITEVCVFKESEFSRGTFASDCYHSSLSIYSKNPLRYEPTLVQAMLTLIIQIVTERQFRGLTRIECLQRHLVCKLSTADATHSQLMNSLPPDLSTNEEVDEVLDRIAVYSNPSIEKQGIYKLRTSYWKELDLYHPTWNSKQLQVAEERYKHFCNESAVTSLLPKWTRIYPPLGGIARLASCRTVLQIIRAAIYYAVVGDKSDDPRAPESVLLTALHLLSLALDICFVHRESGDCSCYDDGGIPILSLAGEELSSSKYGDQSLSLLSLLVLLMRKYREKTNSAEAISISSFIGRLLEKIAELEPEYNEQLQGLAPEVVNSTTNNLESASELENEKFKAKARERQAAIREKMRAEQNVFLKNIGSSAEASSDDPEATPNQIAASGTPQVQLNRCATCRKRVGLTGFKCRCGVTFCGTHRYPEQHGCTFDYRSMGRVAIAMANPLVKAEKLHKI